MVVLQTRYVLTQYPSGDATKIVMEQIHDILTTSALQHQMSSILLDGSCLCLGPETPLFKVNATGYTHYVVFEVGRSHFSLLEGLYFTR